MADFPNVVYPPLPVLTPFHPDSLGSFLPNYATGTLGNATSSTWPTANAAHFYPFFLTQTAIAYQLLFYVGATSSGNIDVGIYDSQFNRIVSSGSTAMSATTNTVQELNIADTTLGAGEYFLAAGCDNATGTCFRVGLADELVLPAVPLYIQTGLTGPTLPSTASPVISTSTNPFISAIGVQFRSVF